MPILQWSKSRVEMELISKIAARAVARAKRYGVDYSPSQAVMDIDACHSNGCPLDLVELAAWSESDNPGDQIDFSHDVFGIRRHINRDTGKLENHFTPRSAYANR